MPIIISHLTDGEDYAFMTDGSTQNTFQYPMRLKLNEERTRFFFEVPLIESETGLIEVNPSAIVYSYKASKQAEETYYESLKQMFSSKGEKKNDNRE